MPFYVASVLFVEDEVPPFLNHKVIFIIKPVIFKLSSSQSNNYAVKMKSIPQKYMCAIDICYVDPHWGRELSERRLWFKTHYIKTDPMD